MKIGIIGGSGLYEMDGITDLREYAATTPFGHPSEVLMAGKLHGVDVIFLSRHGRGHRLNPSEINYRANIFALKDAGVDAIISVSACGSLKEQIAPTDFVIPDQFIDRTYKRGNTFFEDGIVAHVPMAEPFAPELRKVLLDACRELKVSVHKRGTYVNMEGPQFSTLAESRLYRQWEADIIGMTVATEAKLAREAEISYAALAAVTDYDCWHPSHETVTVEMILEYLGKNVENAKKILKAAVAKIAGIKHFSAADALRHAIVTDPKKVPPEKKGELDVLIGKYLK